MQKFLSGLDFGLGDDSWIEDDSHIFGTLNYRDIFKCIQFCLAHLPCQTHLDFDLVRLADSEGHRIHRKMNTADWYWDTQDQHSAGVTIVPVICQFTNFLGDWHAWPLKLTIGNIQKDIHQTSKKLAWILVGLIPCPPKSANINDEARHNVVGTVLSLLRHRDIAGLGLKWEYAAGLQRQCYTLLATWVGDYQEQVIISVSNGSG